MPTTDHTTPAQRGGGDGVRMDCPPCNGIGYLDCGWCDGGSFGCAYCEGSGPAECGVCEGTGTVEAARWCVGCSEPGATVWLPHPTVSDAVLCALEESGRIVRERLPEGRCEACS